MTSAERPFDEERAREILRLGAEVAVEEYLDEPRFVDSDRCAWQYGDDGIVRCLPKDSSNPCGYCARVRVRKPDGSVEIHCVCWD